MTVRLVPMTPEEYGPYLGRLLPEYAAEHVANGRWSAEESMAGARREIDRLLPEGMATPNAHFLTVVAGAPEQPIGAIWLNVDRTNAFLYDLRIDEAHRRHGYARAALLALETYAKAQGAARIGLHVFGRNTAARDLYRSLGYGERDVVMAKELA
jgi:ribosomal protein S18 acetylase RimI-like enzyme